MRRKKPRTKCTRRKGPHGLPRRRASEGDNPKFFGVFRDDTGKLHLTEPQRNKNNALIERNLLIHDLNTKGLTKQKPERYVKDVLKKGS